MSNLYTMRRKELMSEPSYQWPQLFETVFNERSKAYILNVQSDPPYDPFQVEDLLADISKLLDRCLVYRREYEQLDTSAVKAVMDDQLFLNQLGSLKSLELAESIERQRIAERTQHALAAGRFDKNGGWRYMALAAVASSDEALKGEGERKSAVADKWKHLEEYMQTMRQRFEAPGNSFNFSDRLSRLLKFYESDLIEAYQRARAAEKGLRLVFGINSPLPDLRVSDRILDDLVAWNRKSIDLLDVQLEQDSDFEITVYVRQPNGTGKRLITEAAYETAIKGNGELLLDLKDYLPPAAAAKALRVKGVGMSMSYAGNLKEDLHTIKLYRASAVVFPPNSIDPFSPGELGRKPRPACILTNISLTDPNSSIRYLTGVNVNNIDPRGEWRIRVSKTLGYPDASERIRNESVLDIKLHLWLAAHTSADPTNWPDVVIG